MFKSLKKFKKALSSLVSKSNYTKAIEELIDIKLEGAHIKNVKMLREWFPESFYIEMTKFLLTEYKEKLEHCNVADPNLKEKRQKEDREFLRQLLHNLIQDEINLNASK